MKLTDSGITPTPRVTITHNTRYIHIMNKTDRFFNPREWDSGIDELYTRAMYEEYLVELRIHLSDNIAKEHLSTSAERKDPFFVYYPSNSIAVHIGTLERNGIDFNHTLEKKVFSTLLDALSYTCSVTTQHVGDLIENEMNIRTAKGILRDMIGSRYVDLML